MAMAMSLMNQPVVVRDVEIEQRHASAGIVEQVKEVRIVVGHTECIALYRQRLEALPDCRPRRADGAVGAAGIKALPLLAPGEVLLPRLGIDGPVPGGVRARQTMEEADGPAPVTKECRDPGVGTHHGAGSDVHRIGHPAMRAVLTRLIEVAGWRRKRVGDAGAVRPQVVGERSRSSKHRIARDAPSSGMAMTLSMRRPSPLG